MYSSCLLSSAQQHTHTHLLYSLLSHHSSLMRLSFFPTSLLHYSHRLFLSLLLFPPTTNTTNLVSTSSSAPRWSQMITTTRRHQQHQKKKKQKIVVIMGPTGSGKSKLSVDLATRFFPSEIINSDKIQVYRGLDITTNKIPMHDRRGVPHHLLGDFPTHSDLTPSAFRSAAASAISAVSSRRNLPLIVGGSNSFIYALAADRFNPASDVFHDTHPDPVCPDLRYDCCFLWVDVSMPVLNQYLSERVDDMLDSGMFEELQEYFDSDQYRRESNSAIRTGLRKAIGVPEFEPYFKKFHPRTNPKGNPVRMAVYEEAVRAIKENTCQLAERQVGKIMRLRNAGWDLQRLDATEVIRAAMKKESCGSDSGESWERQVVEPSVKIVKRFLEE
ncbi:hypothetical protein LOK49_LG10G00725 [Camellia lanceoleosa]|uniref:Uncharacterized protein n=1 Tax=Camellia lanceoleosa TaxID=1840588 RepID=A0ACC0GDS1_9ERIC|nr:hypothetical protein LOK49_LG10G00725 [Camellia lanceoleosa]